jgi:hypothetical protein
MTFFSLPLRISRQVVGRIRASADQFVAFHQALEPIHLQECHSRAVYVGPADDVSAVAHEVI